MGHLLRPPYSLTNYLKILKETKTSNSQHSRHQKTNIQHIAQVGIYIEKKLSLLIIFRKLPSYLKGSNTTPATNALRT